MAIKQQQLDDEIRSLRARVDAAIDARALEEKKHAQSLPLPVLRMLLTNRAPDQLWSAILTEMGPVYQLMSRMPDDVSLN